ncbi:MAG: peptide chain release factor N(5)-glutamine methyltransferase [Polyangiales bacterium]
MADRLTVRRMLEWMADDFRGRGLDSPRLDAELLVSDTLGVDRVRLYMDLDRPLVPDELTAIRGRVARRRAREPVAYILGRRDFFGRTFHVAKGVLVPRPDSETLVERALALLEPDASTTVVDLCTGSGILGLTLLAERPHLHAILTDVDETALAVARQNAERLGVAARATFVHGDLFDAIPGEARFELIVTNPPYIASDVIDSLDEEVRLHEPRLALDGGADGLRFIHRILGAAPAFLSTGGVLLMETGEDQEFSVRRMAQEQNVWGTVEFHKDLGGRPRVAELHTLARAA